MPTARPFARNTGAAIAGTEQVGNLAVGIPTAGFAATGLPWWNGPDEELGYVIATEVPANNQPTPVSTSYTIGQSALGGIVAYILQPGDPGYDANVQKGLIAATSDQSDFAGWGCSGTSISTSTALGGGVTNTTNILAGCVTRPIAASIAAAHNGGGFSDWFLPSTDEMAKLYINRSFLGSFPALDYWTSSQNSSTLATYTRMTNGGQSTDAKTSNLGVRAVRSFTAAPTTASVGFWRSTAKTDASFIDIAQYVARIAGTPQTFANAGAAATWLNTNGYWTSYSQIVTDGLVVNLDAGNPLSYPGTGITWTDISGNGNNATLINGPTYSSANGGSIVFDGTNDFVATPYMFPGGNLAKSFSVWFNVTNLTQGWIVGGGIDNNDGRAFGLYLNSGTPVFHGNGAAYDMTFNGTINTSTWYNVSISYNGSVLSGYLNGQLNNTKAVILDTYPSPPSGVKLGVNGINSPFAYFNGKIAQAIMYNRALSASEVSQNYNALKSRYGL
jgi:hypothetical protein